MIEDKLKQANDLRSRLTELENFRDLCKRSLSESGYTDSDKNPRVNKFRSLRISSDIWTGTQNTNYDETITNSDDIALLVEVFQENLDVLIKKVENELELLFN